MNLRNARLAAFAGALVLAAALPATADVSIRFTVPASNVGVYVNSYPSLQRIPGYPVYYAPGLRQNYFFYDGLYWLYARDRWYASSWYNGPWGAVDPFDVPLYVLRVPVRYYYAPPSYFRGWRADAPPRWHEHWGRDWERRRAGWDRWDPREHPAPAPLPHYQREFRGDRYPDGSRQAFVQSDRYRYTPREDVSRQHWEERRHEARTHGWQERRQDARQERRQEYRQEQRQEHRQEQRQENRHERRQDRREENRPAQQQKLPTENAPLPRGYSGG